MEKGIYCLLIRNDVEQSFSVGALGEVLFPAGYYIYVGSALGSGGLSRVSRHIRFFRERYRKPKWHVDYLMMHAVLVRAFCAMTEERFECALARAVGGDSVFRFGCSDCECDSHLFYRVDEPSAEVRSAFGKIGFVPVEILVSD